MSDNFKVATIKLVETSPSEIVLHRIEDHQLESLTNVSRPLTLAVAGAAAGAFFSFLPLTVEAFSSFGTDNFTRGSLINCMIMTVSFVVLIFSGASAWKGEVKARDILKSIRKRTQRTI